MQITIFGASGSVGQYLIDEAIKRGHQVIAVSRDHNRIKNPNPNIRAMSVEYDDPYSLDLTLKGSEAAIMSYNQLKP
ncbi:NAD(P)H-binding protein [Bacillus capparidis]|uniref:NADH-flavin reductase n=1 Tax=Bacillus capparidis TaxID=1840411 RepID=A0ABS4CRS8_9BACI|nr:putative NADH-flavin reductase [Bacillus capparidis]MED1094058.1 NAD(P)H-binding protein [Bacillus capparidis]